MFLAIKEKRFAKRMVKHLLKSHSVVSAKRPDLSGKALYREVLLHSQQVDLSHVDEFLRQAEDSVDLWTAGAKEGLGFREIVHNLVLTEYLKAGNSGSIVSFKDIAYSMVPANL